MMTLRERFENFVAGGKLADLEQRVAALGDINERMVNAYQAGPYVLPPGELVRQFREMAEYYDPQMIDQLVDMMRWEQIGGYGAGDGKDRVRAVSESREAYKYSILARYAVNLWTAYALGANVQIIVEDEAGQETWAEFQGAKRNKALLAKDRIDELSRWLLVAGERFLAYYASTQDGETTVRSIQPEQITRVLCNPEDAAEAWFYERRWQETGKDAQRCLYYPDWETWFGVDAADKPVLEDRWNQIRAAYNLGTDAKRADEEKGGTDVVMQFSPFIQLDEDSPRGWPLLAPHGTPWFRAHRDFMQSRLAMAKAGNMYIRKAQVSGGSRGVNQVINALASTQQFGAARDTNPPATAGSTLVSNKAVDFEEMPLRTGASDAKNDGEMFAWYALLAVGIFPHYAGMGDAYRLATAASMEKPLELQFSLYRNQIGAMLREMVEIVLRFQEKYNNASFETYDAQISTDRMVHLDSNNITEALSRLWSDVITPQAATIPQEVLDRLLVFSVQTAVEALGQDNPEDLISDEMFTQPTAAEAALIESHVGEVIQRTCPLCAWPQALSYPDHGGLLVCEGCHMTFDPEVE